ncbi:hypothetical protein SBC1_38850 (plasmid) [Caballeronia sp. SBC1]|uniref:hypothetical protein n=1 Tax=Caballeronia sp. SBC1 TaxID=2705548 RepID=UPI0013E0EB20|nr:hypothetical protein SBC2_49090 [Caballeronia sp. SBC2]QIN63845.1 hypothetical protein SBC1_38850 [Caballeronia sp. SBC1]
MRFYYRNAIREVSDAAITRIVKFKAVNVCIQFLPTPGGTALFAIEDLRRAHERRGCQAVCAHNANCN